MILTIVGDIDMESMARSLLQLNNENDTVCIVKYCKGGRQFSSFQYSLCCLFIYLQSRITWRFLQLNKMITVVVHAKPRMTRQELVVVCFKLLS
jgi:hypothetical protein